MPEQFSPKQQALLDEELARIRAVRARDAEALRQHQGVLGEPVEQIRQLRSEIEERVGKLAGTCQQLQQTCRRNPSELTRGYLVFTNSHLRLAGALQQALRRTSSSERVLDQTHREAEHEQMRQAQEQSRQDFRLAERRVNRILRASDSDFDNLFGEEEVDVG